MAKANLLKAVCMTLAALILLAAAGVFIINIYMKSSVGDNMIGKDDAEHIGDVDCIIILGCGVSSDGRPSAMLKDRLNEGIGLYKSGVSNRLLMSGDHGREDYDEVNTMKSFAEAEGVPSADIFMDHAGFSTYETMYRARDIFLAKKVVVVTQEYHLYRALYIAKSLGLEAYGVAAAPSIEYYGQRARDVREYIARVKDFAFCILKPEPKYLGDVIPVSGSGSATNDKTDRD